MSKEQKVKWETWLSAEDHIAAEAQREILGLSQAGFTRAALLNGEVIEADGVAQMIGIAGQVLYDLDVARTSWPDLRPLLDPVIAQLREALVLGTGNGA